MIHSESYKLAAAEAAKRAICGENAYQCNFISYRIRDKRDPNRSADVVGVFRRRYAIGSRVDNNWLTLG